jgi:hypothetical protein
MCFRNGLRLLALLATSACAGSRKPVVPPEEHYRSVIPIEPVGIALLRLENDSLLFTIPIWFHNTRTDTIYLGCRPLAQSVKNAVWASWGRGLDPCEGTVLRAVAPNARFLDTALVVIARGPGARAAFKTWPASTRFRVLYMLRLARSEDLHHKRAARSFFVEGRYAGSGWSKPFVLVRP